MENNKGELYVFESESDHSDKQKKIKHSKANLRSNQIKNQMNNQTLQICLIKKLKNLLRKEKNRKQKD